jgi:hypothetical protein
MDGSARAAAILWGLFHSLGDTAAQNTRNHMNTLLGSSPANDDGSTPLSLAFPSTGFHDDYSFEKDDLSQHPLSFAIMIPMFRSTGKIGLESEGYQVDDAQFVFPDIRIGITFPPDTVCMMLLRDQEYAHGLLNPTLAGESTRLGVCINPLTKLNNTSIKQES